MVDGISKEELSEAIEDGIVNGFWMPIMYVMGTIVLILVLLAGIGWYQSYQYDKCVESGECPRIGSVSIPSNTITCDVIAGNGTYSASIYQINALGYQEMEAKFNLIEPMLNSTIKEEHPDYTIKYLRC